MSKKTVQYFNSLHTEPIEVRIEIKESELYLIELVSNRFKKIAFSKCKCTQQDENVVIFLSKQDDYLVIPTSSVYYFPLISKIRKFQSFAKPQLVLFLSIFFILLVASYLFFAKVVPFIAVKFVSIKQETSIGDQYYSAFIKNVDIDSQKTEELQKFADNLRLSNKYNIRVTVVSDTIVKEVKRATRVGLWTVDSNYHITTYRMIPLYSWPHSVIRGRRRNQKHY